MIHKQNRRLHLVPPQEPPHNILFEQFVGADWDIARPHIFTVDSFIRTEGLSAPIRVHWFNPARGCPPFPHDYYYDGYLHLSMQERKAMKNLINNFLLIEEVECLGFFLMLSNDIRIEIKEVALPLTCDVSTLNLARAWETHLKKHSPIDLTDQDDFYLDFPVYGASNADSLFDRLRYNSELPKQTEQIIVENPEEAYGY